MGSPRAGAGRGRPPARPPAAAAPGHRVSLAAPDAQPTCGASGRRGVVRGSVRVPGDKSISHRAALFNALGEGEARHHQLLAGRRLRARRSAACARWASTIERDGGSASTCDGRRPARPARAGDVLDCGNSGTSMRLLQRRAGRARACSRCSAATARCAAGRWRASSSRCGALGAAIDGRDGGRLPPLAISPVAGLRGVEHRLTVASAQVKSALLLAGLFARRRRRRVDRASADARPHRAAARAPWAPTCE